MNTRTTLDPTTIHPATLANLDPSQADAVTTLDGPLLVVAGPGSGKTRVLTRRLAALVDAGVYPSRLLAVTFTNKAAAEMRDRLADLIGPEEAKRAQVSTFHSLCARVLRQFHDAVGLPRQFTILDADDAARVVNVVAQRAGHLEGLERTEVTAFIKETSSAISNAKNFGRTAADLMGAPDPTTRRHGELMAAYNDQLAAQGAVDFDDLLTYVHWLLVHDEGVAETLRARWHYVSVDEFQDTNAVQYAIIRELVADHHNLCVVGDADQSIYAFRGAQPSVVRTFARDFENVKVVVLEHNYRSTANICEVSKAVISANESKYRSPQAAVADAGHKVALTGYTDDRAEADAVVALIKARGGLPNQHAVLVRTNALTRSLEQALTYAHLDYEVVGATRFYDRAEVKDAMAWLRLAANDRDQMAFARAASVPRRGIGSVTLAKLSQVAHERGISMTEAAHAYANQKSKSAAVMAEFLSQVDTVRDSATRRGPVAALTYILDVVGVREVVRERDRKERTMREENLDQLLSHAADFDNHPEGPQAAMEAYLESVSLLESTDGDSVEDMPDQRVQILTIHAAKGKEFKHVYVIGLEQDVLPHSRSLNSGNAEELAEERRLLFVATSRAQRTLDLSWCAQRMRFGKVASCLPSQFLDEIPRTLLTVKDPAPVTWANSQSGGFGSRSSGGWSNGRSTGGYRSGTGSVAGGATRPPVVFGQRPRAGQAEKTSLLATVSVGARVHHAMFGPGAVTETNPSADTLTVAFDNGTSKVLSATLAPLTVT